VLLIFQSYKKFSSILLLLTEESPQLKHLKEKFKDSHLLSVFHIHLKRLYFSLTTRCFVCVCVCMCACTHVCMRACVCLITAVVEKGDTIPWTLVAESHDFATLRIQDTIINLYSFYQSWYLVLCTCRL
jgi:hypothetical protein